MSDFHDSPAVTGVTVRPPKDIRFWLVLLSLCTALFLSALELSIVSPALPVITADFHGEDFVWVGSAYGIGSSAILPMTGGLAQIFGRRSSFLASTALFGIGCIIAGAAKNMGMLIAGRTVQGVGGGGILSLTTIIISDMVSLEERGLFAGAFYGGTFSLAGASGAIIGGSLAGSGQWRWIFYLNLPLCGLSGGLALMFLNLPTPTGTLREKVSQMDWIGNFLVMTATCSISIALTFGGINFPWSSAHILVPLIIGIAGFIIFIIYEAIWATYPLVPLPILSNLTSVSGYLQTFILPVTTLAMIYYVPTYFQACKGADPLSAAVRTLGLSAISLSAVIGGVSVKILKCYRPQIWVAWALQIIGGGLMTTVTADTPSAHVVGFCVLYGAGAGTNYAVSIFPVQAPLPITRGAQSLAFFAFMRAFASIWGVTLGGAILQNELLHRLPEELVAQFPQGVAIAYPVIPQIRDLPQPLKHNVENAFAESLQVVWKAVVGVSGAGMLTSFFMKGLPLHTVTDEAWDPSKQTEKSRS